MAIGYFGDVVFSTSDQKILSFTDFKMNTSGSWGEHKRIGRKSEWEYMGPNAIKVSFTIMLDANYGVNPRNLIEQLNTYVEEGCVFYLVIGEKRIGSRWRATNVSSSWKHVMKDGKLQKASVSLSIEEYE